MKILKQNIYTGNKCRASAFKEVKRFGILTGVAYEYIKIDSTILIKVDDTHYIDVDDIIASNLPKNMALKVCKKYSTKPSQKGDIFINNTKPYFKNINEDNIEKCDVLELYNNELSI